MVKQHSAPPSVPIAILRFLLSFEVDGGLGKFRERFVRVLLLGERLIEELNLKAELALLNKDDVGNAARECLGICGTPSRPSLLKCRRGVLPP